MATSFNNVYSVFFSKITDDMYMELNRGETEKMVKELLLNAVPYFEFPKQDIACDVDNEEFISNLTKEEINIIATYMVVTWLDQQLASVDNVRQKYTGADFKMTSQANHMSKIQDMKRDYERSGFHLQRLYKRRRKDKDGIMRSTFDIIMKPRTDI